MKKLYRHFKGDSFDILAIDVKERRDVVLRYVRRKGLPFRILLDEDGLVSARYGVRSHPMKFLVDTQGNLIGYALGYRDWYKDDMKSLIRSLISSKGSLD